MDEDRLDEALTSTASPESTARAKSTRKADPNIQTYYSSPEIRSNMGRLQKEWNVNKSELTRWLLERALEFVEKGKLRPKKETITRAELD